MQRQRAALEVHYEHARHLLDAKTDPAPPPDAAVLEPGDEPELVMPPLRTLKKPFIAGLIVGLLSWFQTFGHPR